MHRRGGFYSRRREGSRPLAQRSHGETRLRVKGLAGRESGGINGGRVRQKGLARCAYIITRTVF